jgi:hypothetical protein
MANDFKGWSLLGGLLNIAEISNQVGFLIVDQQPSGGTCKPTLVRAILGIGDQQGIEFLCGHDLAKLG